jgi:hypothetical protein
MSFVTLLSSAGAGEPKALVDAWGAANSARTNPAIDATRHFAVWKRIIAVWERLIDLNISFLLMRVAGFSHGGRIPDVPGSGLSTITNTMPNPDKELCGAVKSLNPRYLRPAKALATELLATVVWRAAS